MKHRLLLTSTVIGVTLGFAAEAHAAPTDAAGQTKLATAGAGASDSSSAGATQTQMTPQEQQQLLQEVRSLRERVSALENKVTAVQSTPPLAKEHKAGDHNLELYGFIQLDAIQDFKRVNPELGRHACGPRAFRRSSGQFGSDGQSIFSVRQSRLGAKATGMLAGKPYEAKFEFDLFGVGVDEGQTTMRLRHAYASWGPFLAGQTNSLFMDGDIFPNTIDYWGPAGMVFLRNPQLRWTFCQQRRLESRGRARASEQRHRHRQPPPDRSRPRRRTSRTTRRSPT